MSRAKPGKPSRRSVMRRSSCSRGGIAAWSGCHDPPASTRNALEGGTVIFQSHILPEHDIRPYSVPQLAERSGCSDSMIRRSDEHTSELQSLMRISYAVFCLNKKTQAHTQHTT